MLGSRGRCERVGDPVVGDGLVVGIRCLLRTTEREQSAYAVIAWERKR